MCHLNRCPTATAHALDGFCAAAKAAGAGNCLVCVACTPAELDAFCPGLAPALLSPVLPSPGHSGWAATPFSILAFSANQANDGGGGDTPSIQAALDAAANVGGIVRVPAGVYGITGLALQTDHGAESDMGLHAVRIVGDGKASVMQVCG